MIKYVQLNYKWTFFIWSKTWFKPLLACFLTLCSSSGLHAVHTDEARRHRPPRQRSWRTKFPEMEAEVVARGFMVLNNAVLNNHMV